MMKHSRINCEVDRVWNSYSETIVDIGFTTGTGIIMSNLINLARLIKWATLQEVCGFHLSTPLEWVENIEQQEYTRYWQADIMTPTIELVGNKAQTIEDACQSLIDICNKQEFEIPNIVNVETVIPNHQDVDIHITNLYKMLPKFKKYPCSVLFQCMIGPMFLSGGCWHGSIYYDSKWLNYNPVNVSGDTLYEICIKLWEEGVKKLE